MWSLYTMLDATKNTHLGNVKDENTYMGVVKSYGKRGLYYQVLLMGFLTTFVCGNGDTTDLRPLEDEELLQKALYSALVAGGSDGNDQVLSIFTQVN